MNFNTTRTTEEANFRGDVYALLNLLESALEGYPHPEEILGVYLNGAGQVETVIVEIDDLKSIASFEQNLISALHHGKEGMELEFTRGNASSYEMFTPMVELVEDYVKGFYIRQIKHLTDRTAGG